MTFFYQPFFNEIGNFNYLRIVIGKKNAFFFRGAMVNIYETFLKNPKVLLSIYKILFKLKISSQKT